MANCDHGVAQRQLSVVSGDWSARVRQSARSICLLRWLLNSPTTSAERTLSASSSWWQVPPSSSSPRNHVVLSARPKMRSPIALALLLGLVIVSAEVYLDEKFPDDSWEQNWVYSEHPDKEFGKFVLSHGKFWNDAENDKGIQTSQDARFYALSKKFTPFSNKDKTLVIQFTVKHEQNIDCGGGYIKVFDCSLDQKDMHGETPYEIMFGPDICGPGIKKVHVIFSYKGKNLLINKDIRCKDDIYTHLYTLIVKPDNTYKVLIDNEEVESGELEADWAFLPPKKIKDPSQTKPADWDDNISIDDPEDKKPEDWDKPKHIPDPEATKPEDWDDEMDGEWEAPMIDNPEYKGEWKPKQIDNPNYKGPWIHPEIDNPEYTADPELYKRDEICAVGFDLWQVKSGTIFDNVLITDDPEVARKFGEEVWKPTLEGEKKMKEAQDEEERKQRDKEAKENINKDDEDDEDEDNIPDTDDEDNNIPNSEDEDNNIPDADEHDEL
ncbi:calreticulin [Cataglyphis hispanica]|uniref:calreticulin n=1 Tax=Cataglyphis hispanica TaxID=1086592 RepID=UPI00217F6134|nr:calreticulin [Cataglyphis hispanica]